jgi:DNA polymerase-3 subunit epsilon
VNDSQATFDLFGMPEWAKRVVVFDTETTGLSLTNDRIVTACAIELDANGQVVGERREWLANPGIPIPPIATSVHGITNEIAARAGRPAGEVIGEILDTLRGYLNDGVAVVAYNAPYDFTILHFEALRHGFAPLDSPAPVIDPLVIDKKLDKWRKGSRKLEAVAPLYGVSLENAHTAADDAIAAGRVAQAIARKFAGELPAEAMAMHEAQVAWSREQVLSFIAWKKKTEPDFYDEPGWPVKPVAN